MLQLSGNCESSPVISGAAISDTAMSGTPISTAPMATLFDLRRGEAGVVDRIDLPGDDARRLMELGFMPGARVTAGLSAPGGDPKVFQVDGSEIALRGETARRMKIRRGRSN